jgi:hypothetical protein
LVPVVVVKEVVGPSVLLSLQAQMAKHQLHLHLVDAS